MESLGRGQLPARQTKVVDESQRPTKTGSTMGCVCSDDVISSKPSIMGRDVTDDTQTSFVSKNVEVKSVKHVIILLKVLSSLVM